MHLYILTKKLIIIKIFTSFIPFNAGIQNVSLLFYPIYNSSIYLIFFTDAIYKNKHEQAANNYKINAGMKKSKFE